MSSKRLRRKGVVSSGVTCYSGGDSSNSNSLDWDSPSNVTGTVKRRPLSSDCTILKVKEITTDLRGNLTSTRNTNDNVELNDTNSIIITRTGLNRKISLNPRRNGTNLEIKHNLKVNVPNPMQISHGNNNIFNKYKSGSSKVTLIPTKISLNTSRNTTDDHQVKSNCKIIDDDDDDDDDVIDGKGFSFGTNCKIETYDSTTPTTTYLIERKTWKNGKVSDSDSGIASPLSPSSTYGFPVCYDKDIRHDTKDDNKKFVSTEETFNKQQTISYSNHNLQVREMMFFYRVSYRHFLTFFNKITYAMKFVPTCCMLYNKCDVICFFFFNIINIYVSLVLL